MSPPPEPTCRFFLFRHGAVAAPWSGRIYGDLDVPLSERGREEARRAAARVAHEPLAAVISSGLERAEYGAARLRAGRGLARRDERDLREIRRGAWRGLDHATLAPEVRDAWRSWNLNPDRERAPEGESLDELAARVLPRIDSLSEEFAGEAVAVVGHAWVLRTIVCEVLRLERRLAPRLEIPTGALIVVDWPGGRSGDGGAGGGGGSRPTLAGFGVDRPPEAGLAWFRGPRRG